MKMKNNKNYNIVFLRFLAILIVVFGHSIIIYDPGWAYFTTSVKSNFLMNTKHIINVIQMPLYFAISGYVFYYTISKKSSKLQLITNKFKRLIIPYIVFSFILVIPIRYIFKYESYNGNSFIYNIWYNIILGHDCGHLWFLLTLFLMMIPFIFINKNSSKLVDIIIFFLVATLNIISYKFTQYANYITYYSVYFYLGLLLNKYPFKKKLNIIFILIPLLMLVVFNHYTLADYVLFVLKLLLLLFILIIMFNINFENFGKITIINNIANNSYGIYLFHSPSIVFMFYYFPKVHPLITILVNFFILGFLSYIITSLIKKSKIKFIIGE